MTDYLISETQYFRIEQSYEILIPGYLIVSMKKPIAEFSQMPHEVAVDLGQSLQMACRIAEKIIKPERVYVAKFGEECKQIHFHILPRTLSLLEEYKQTLGMKDEPISGPQIFDWVRNKYRSNGMRKDLDPSFQKIIEQMRLEASL